MQPTDKLTVLRRLVPLAILGLLLAMLACVAPTRTDHSPDDEVDDSGGSPPIGDDDHPPAPPIPGDDDTAGDDDDAAGDDDDAAGDDDTAGDDDDSIPGSCPDGEMEDCNGNCAPSSWCGDKECDEEAYRWPDENGPLIDFNCAAHSFDCGDCVQQ